MGLDDDDDEGGGRVLSSDALRLPNTTFVRPLFTPPRTSMAAALEMSVTPGADSTRQRELLHSEEVAEPPEVVRVTTGQSRDFSFMDLVISDHIPYLPEVLDDEPSNPGTRIRMKSSHVEFPNLFSIRGWPSMHNMT